MLDIIGEVLEALLSGGLPGPNSLRGQRWARLSVAVLAFVAIVTAPVVSNGSTRAALMAGGALVGVWVVAFSCVDFAKELPAFHWPTTCAIVIGGTDVALAIIPLLRHLLNGREDR